MSAYQLSPLEQKARELLETIEPGLINTSVKIVFTAMWSSALSAARIAEISSALGGSSSQEHLQAVLTTLVRARVLRSRKDRGINLYELNI